MDITWGELNSNNIDIDKDTLSFHIDDCLKEHVELYETIIHQTDGDNLPNSLSRISTEMEPNNFGRIIAYLTLVYKVTDSLDEETTRDAVRRTVEEFKRLSKLMISLVFAYLHG